MRDKLTRHGPLILAVLFAVLCACVLMIYIRPMEDVSLDLSLVSQEDSLSLDPEEFDDKGWTVYTQEGDTRTELVPNGFGGYTGLELGETFYFSRVLEEALDSPTLQLGTVEWQFSVWLDDTLIYTDCPELDNRIGYVQLPMSEWLRNVPIAISLPADYQGKTLTIAQSFPEWPETGSVTAWPTAVRLYCGYAYESGLISETFQTALLAAFAFLLVLVLLAGYVRNRNWSLICLAVVAFLWMAQLLAGTSFYYRYFSSFDNTPAAVIPQISALALLCYLSLQGGKYKKLLWIPVIGCALAILAETLILVCTAFLLPGQESWATFISSLSIWFVFVGLMAVLAAGTVWWQKENLFYRHFVPLAFICIAVSWAIQIFFVHKGVVWEQILLNLRNGHIQYIHTHTLTGIKSAAFITAVMDAVKAELNRRAEQQLIQQQKELSMASYENLCRHQEEVMMLRHDMIRHFRTLREMDSEEKRMEYLSQLIGQSETIRPVVMSGNEMLDIILNARLGAAVDAGIRVELPHVSAPAELPLSDPDLCALVMNIVDNAITAASKAAVPYMLLKIHQRDGFLGIVCENSFDLCDLETEAKKETVPKHGLGLKIIKGIVAKYSGVITTQSNDDHFVVKLVIPL